jgi:hypothetical protein
MEAWEDICPLRLLFIILGVGAVGLVVRAVGAGVRGREKGKGRIVGVGDGRVGVDFRILMGLLMGGMGV